jgi:hypothetical protein
MEDKTACPPAESCGDGGAAEEERLLGIAVVYAYVKGREERCTVHVVVSG